MFWCEYCKTHTKQPRSCLLADHVARLFVRGSRKLQLKSKSWSCHLPGRNYYIGLAVNQPTCFEAKAEQYMIFSTFISCTNFVSGSSSFPAAVQHAGLWPQHSAQPCKQVDELWKGMPAAFFLNNGKAGGSDRELNLKVLRSSKQWHQGSIGSCISHSRVESHFLFFVPLEEFSPTSCFYLFKGDFCVTFQCWFFFFSVLPFLYLFLSLTSLPACFIFSRLLYRTIVYLIIIRIAL